MVHLNAQEDEFMIAPGKCSYATVKNAVLLEEMQRAWRAEGHSSSRKLRKYVTMTTGPRERFACLEELPVSSNSFRKKML